MTQEMILRRAPLGATTWNATDRTFRAVIAAGATVERFDAKGLYLETLDPAGMQIAGKVPLLQSHNRGNLSDILGSVLSTQTRDGQIEATLQLSSRAEVEPILQDILDGHISGVSIGYRVLAWSEQTIDGKRIKTATRWQLLEVSLVAVPADPAAVIRGSTMPDPVITTTDDAAAAVAARAQINSQIRSIAEIAGLDRAFADAQIDAGASVEDARAAAFAAMQARSRATQTVRTVVTSPAGDDPEVRRSLMADALLTRCSPAHKPAEQARQFIGMSLVDCARELLRSANVSTMGMTPSAVVTRAMTTSDFPILLGDVLGKELRTAYAAAPSGLKRVARATTARDFRAKHKIQISGPLTLEQVNERGEFKAGAFAEGKESYNLATFGRIVSFSRRAVIDDDIGGLADPARHLGRAAAEQEAAALASLLASNPVMSDTKALFATEHGNLAGSGAAISDTTLSAARLALRTQTGLSGEPISVTPKFVVCGPALETAAEKTIAAVQAATTTDVNPFSFLTLVIEPRISGNGWYVVASPDETDGLEYAHLEGEQGPQVISEMGFDVDAVRFRVRNDFGCGFTDYRGWFCNGGA